jgi:hypothetical protein
MSTQQEKKDKEDKLQENIAKCTWMLYMISMPSIILVVFLSLSIKDRAALNCASLYPKTLYTETTCFINSNLVLLAIRSCKWSDVAVLTEKNNQTSNYFKVWGTCWYQTDQINCATLYPGMPIYQNQTVYYDEPRSFQMLRDHDSCVKEYDGVNGNVVLFAIFFSITATFQLIFILVILSSYYDLRNLRKESS